MTVREFIRTVWAGKWYVLAAVLVVVAGALYYLSQQETQFEAKATVALTGVQTAQGGEKLVEVTVDASADDVTSPEVAAGAATILDRSGDEAELVSQVVAEGDGGKNITIRATTLEPQESVDLANAFAESFVAQLPAIQAAQVAQIDARRQVLATQLAAVTAKLGANPSDPLALAEQDTIVQEYTSLTVQINTLTSIVDPGTVSKPAEGAEPLGLPQATVVVLAVLIGLVAGIGLAFARRGLDMRVRGASDAARLAVSPVLAELYGVRTSDREYSHSHTLPVSRKVATPFTESIRELRTAVQVALADAENVVVVVTAADARAPRSFIAANLAASFALSGRRTVAVSGDLRRPELDGVLPPPEGWAGDPRTLRPTTIPNLTVFPVPEEEMDPADFLATTRAGNLISELSVEADVVVIDAPPVLAAADATILGRYASGVVLIASAGKTDRVVLAEAAERLRINNVPLVGIALAGVKSDRRMLYASTYGDPESQTTSEGQGSRVQAEAQGAVQGARGQDEGTVDVPRRAAVDRAAAVVVEASPTGPQQTPQQPPEGSARATFPTAEAASTSSGANPAPSAAVTPDPARLSRREAAGRPGPLLAPEWGKVSQAAPAHAAGQSADATAREGGEGKSTRKLPFRW